MARVRLAAPPVVSANVAQERQRLDQADTVTGDQNNEAAIHNGMGASHQEVRVGKALDHYQLALDAHLAAGSCGGVAKVRQDLALVEMTVRRKGNARDRLL